MSAELELVVAAYQDLESAQEDFDSLRGKVADKSVPSRGMLLIAKDDAGKVLLYDSGDHLGRRGAGWGGVGGVLVGLFAPPMLAAVAVGAAAGGVVGKFTGHKLTAELRDKIGDNLQPGSGVILGVFPAEQRLVVERTLAQSPVKSVAEMDEATLAELKDALAEGMGKFSPDRSALPIEDRAFGGVVGANLHESVPDWSFLAGVQAPPDAPNVLVVLIDDAGYGSIDSFGGPVSAPTFTRVQEMGLTYNRFHVTAVCSPTRAALLTGRNQHRVGFGSIAEYPGPFPGYSAKRPRSCTPFPRVLRENGYVTGGFGKWHLTPDNVQGAAGPFDNWPKAWGFDHWWGFLSGAAGQYDPIITMDDSVLGVPDGKNGEQYYFPDDLTDKAVEWLHAVRAQDTTKPWMMYYSTGCAHAPHHVAKEWADRYKGIFDDGWDALREQTLQRQKDLGIVPPDTELTPRPDLFPAWDSLAPEEKKLYIRQMEVYAGFQENADWNVGRLMDAIEAMGDLDNTLVFYIWGDNGASLEGTLTGSFNETTFLNGIVLDASQQLELIDQYGGIDAIGGIHTAPHVAAAWAHAMNTPFRWGKQMASHLGGTRDPMAVAWPARITPDKRVRVQFTHCIDVGPTILEAAGIPEPTAVDGIAQQPMDGTSFLYSFHDADAAEQHTTQFFEMFGGRAMYQDGWWAASKLDRVPWDFSPETISRYGPDTDWHVDQDATWELYHLPDDFSQAHDLAAEHPDKVKELQQLWWAEAERNHALPLMAGLSLALGILPPLPTITRFGFAGDVQNIQRGMTPRVYGRSYSIEANLHVPPGGAEGVILANADFIGGFGLWVDAGGLLHHTYSLLGVETYKQVSQEPLPTGDISVRMLFESDEPTPGSGGNVTLYIGDKQVGEGRLPRTVPLAFTTYAGMDIGRDNGLVVDLDYEDKAPYAFTGTVRTVVFDLMPMAHDDQKALHDHATKHTVGQGAAG